MWALVLMLGRCSLIVAQKAVRWWQELAVVELVVTGRVVARFRFQAVVRKLCDPQVRSLVGQAVNALLLGMLMARGPWWGDVGHLCLPPVVVL